LERAEARALADRLSGVFRRYPDVYEGRATVALSRSRRYLLNSEGTRVAAGQSLPSLLDLWASTRASDGMRLSAHRRWMLRRLSDLPPEAELVKAAESMAAELAAGRQATVQAPL